MTEAKRWFTRFLFILFVGLASTVARAEEPRAVQRFAVVVGANDGGKARVQLQYAASDARTVAKVLSELGGVDRDDVAVVLQPSGPELRNALRKAAERVSTAHQRGERTHFVFYYSGHSDERGLMLGEEQVSYPELRKLLDEVPAHVRIGILDSCASGAFTRSKGGRRRAPFLVGGADVAGHAFLTSSSIDEAAQESDGIRGSFFTHFLVSGLRGAADHDRDRKITLDEAYQFAFAETLARTESSSSGPQHANYDIQLTGTGELVITDLRRTTAGLALGPDVDGRVYVRTEAGELAGELYKPPGSGRIELALEPGTYAVVVEQSGKLSRARAILKEGRTTHLTAAHLGTFRGEQVTTRGKDKPYHRIPVTMSLFPPLSVNSVVRDRKVENNLAINWIAGHAARIRGVELGLGVNWVDEDVRGAQLAVGANLVGTELRGAQWSVGANFARGGLRGLQLAVGGNVASTRRAPDPAGPMSGGQLSVAANIARGDFHGLQATVAANIVSGSLRGIQLNSGFNYARSVRGGQVGVIGNLATHEVTGVQWTTGANVAAGGLKGMQMSVAANFAATKSLEDRGHSGAQLGVVANVAKGHFRGAQIGAVANVVTGDLHGVQLDSGVNVARSVVGAQFGLVNIARGRVRGAQFGLINYADDADASIGLLGISRKGGVGGDFWTDDVAMLNAGLRLRTRYTYTMVSVGVHPLAERHGGHWNIGTFFGGHIDLAPRVYLDIDVGHRWIFPGFDRVDRQTRSVFTIPRVLVGVRLGKYASFFGGPSLNLYLRDRARDDFRPGYKYDVYRRDETGWSMRIWPGFALGVRVR